MRALALTLVVLVAVAGGCLNKPGTTNSPTNATNSTMTGNMTMGKEVVNETHSFSPAAQAPATKAFKVDAGYSKINLTVRFRANSGTPAPAPAGVSQGVQVKVGSLVCTLPDGPILPTMGPAPCTKQGDVTPGDMKVEYAGTGEVAATVIVVVT